MEKNKDPLNDTVVDQFKRGENELMEEHIFGDHPGQSGVAPDAGGKGISKYFLSFFESSLVHVGLK